MNHLERTKLLFEIVDSNGDRMDFCSSYTDAENILEDYRVIARKRLHKANEELAEAVTDLADINTWVIRPNTFN